MGNTFLTFHGQLIAQTAKTSTRPGIPLIWQLWSWLTLPPFHAWLTGFHADQAHSQCIIKIQYLLIFNDVRSKLMTFKGLKNWKSNLLILLIFHDAREPWLRITLCHYLEQGSNLAVVQDTQILSRATTVCKLGGPSDHQVHTKVHGQNYKHTIRTCQS